MRVRNKSFGTYPTIFHHPGRIGDINGNRVSGIVKLKQRFFESIADPDNRREFFDRKEKIQLSVPRTPETSNPVSNLSVVFVSNLKELGSSPRSLDHFGIPYFVLGKDIVEWSNAEKLRAIHEFLPEVETKYLMFLDSDDTFVISHLRYVVDLFEREFSCEMLINAAQNCWPPELFSDEFRECVDFAENVAEARLGSRKYINSGAWIARTSFYREFSEDLLATKAPQEGDDQGLFYILYKKYYPRILLDYRCQIFHCEFDEELEVLE